VASLSFLTERLKSIFRKYQRLPLRQRIIWLAVAVLVPMASSLYCLGASAFLLRNHLLKAKVTLIPAPSPTPILPISITLTPTATSSPLPSPTATSPPAPTLQPTPTQKPLPTSASRKPTVTATHAPSPTLITTRTPNLIPTPRPAPSVHIGDLDGQSVKLQRGYWKAVVTITIHDGTHAALSGVTVFGTFHQNGTSVGPFSCRTDAGGTCSVDSGQLLAKQGKTTFTVTDVSTPLGYDPTANHDPDGDSDGTSTTISK